MASALRLDELSGAYDLFGMNVYHIWANLKPGTSDLEFSSAVDKYLGMLKEAGKLETWRITRRKLGLGDPAFPEFHIMVEFKSLEQLDQAFAWAAERSEPIESFHFAVNSKATDVKFALYRDFPDPGRKTGSEKF